jgi:hypothetical protein
MSQKATSQNAPLDIFREANILLSGDRLKEYGSIETSCKRVAAIWSVIFDFDVEPHEVALALAGLKMARLVESGKEDSFVDLAAYTKMAHALHPDIP